MSEQKWADACTTNCVWLLQKRDIPNGCYRETDDTDEDGEYPFTELDEESFHDEQCWDTVEVFLNRLEAFEAGARRVYHYGQYGKGWRIYGVPAKGNIVQLLSNAGVNQEMIDKNVAEYKTERIEWEKIDNRVKDES